MASELKCLCSEPYLNDLRSEGLRLDHFEVPLEMGEEVSKCSDFNPEITYGHSKDSDIFNSWVQPEQNSKAKNR